MKINRSIFAVLLLLFLSLNCLAQNGSSYLKEHAIDITDPQNPGDDVYKLLSPFKVIMVGEMHGTNEPAQFVVGLSQLMAAKADSVQVGLEIPEEQMSQFRSIHSADGVYSSTFFANPKSLDGRESFAWAGIIATLNNNPKIKLFFFDVNENEGLTYQRDSLMYTKIRKQIKLHPNWKTITISGNFHAMTSPEAQGITGTMGSYLKNDPELKLSDKICSLNNYYLSGKCNADFGKGLQERELGHPPSVLDTTLSFDKYLVLASPTNKDLPYTGVYYTKYITPSKMVKSR